MCQYGQYGKLGSPIFLLNVGNILAHLVCRKEAVVKEFKESSKEEEAEEGA